MEKIWTFCFLTFGFSALSQVAKPTNEQCIRFTDQLQIDQYDTTFTRNDTTHFAGNVWASGKYLVENAKQIMIYQNNERMLVVSPEKSGGFKRVIFRQMDKGAEVHAVMFDKNLTVIWTGKTETEHFIPYSDYDFSDYDLSVFED